MPNQIHHSALVSSDARGRYNRRSVLKTAGAVAAGGLGTAGVPGLMEEATLHRSDAITGSSTAEKEGSRLRRSRNTAQHNTTKARSIPPTQNI